MIIRYKLDSMKSKTFGELMKQFSVREKYFTAALCMLVLCAMTFVWSSYYVDTDLRVHKLSPLRQLNTHKITWYNYTIVGDSQFHIFSAIASAPDDIIVVGWEPRESVKNTYKGCFYHDAKIEVLECKTKSQFFIHATGIEARHVVCKMPKSVRPHKVTLVLSGEECPRFVNGTVITYPEIPRGDQLVVCGKIVYCKKNPLELIEWIEFHRYFGANKIVIYAYQDLRRDSLAVLQYYTDTMLGTFEFILMPWLPGQDRWPRSFVVRRNMETLNDEQIQIYDTVFRFRHYTYLAIVDVDEFIAPNMNLAKTYQELMKHLMTSYKKAGTFQLLTQLYMMSWKPTNQSSDLTITKYCNRTQSTEDRVKFIHVNDRVAPETIWIHNVDPKPGYHKVKLKDSEAALKHYRSCREEWLADDAKIKCFGGFKMQYDPYMEIVAKQIEPRIRETQCILRLSNCSNFFHHSNTFSQIYKQIGPRSNSSC